MLVNFCSVLDVNVDTPLIRRCRVDTKKWWENSPRRACCGRVACLEPSDCWGHQEGETAEGRAWNHSLTYHQAWRAESQSSRDPGNCCLATQNKIPLMHVCFWNSNISNTCNWLYKDFPPPSYLGCHIHCCFPLAERTITGMATVRVRVGQSCPSH